MSDQTEAQVSKRFRSPPYPALPLEKAVARAKELYAKALHHPVGVSVLADAWSYGAKSSGLWATAAALIQYALLTDEGSGDKRKFQLTDAALRIIRDPDPLSEKRRTVIKKSALRPKIHKELWDRFGAAQSLSDVVLKSYLTVDRHEQGQSPYSDTAANDLVRVFKSTISFAGLGASDTISEAPVEMDQELGADPASSGEQDEPMQPQAENSARRADPGGPGDMSVLLQGNRLKINATVDADGIAKLKQVLDKYEEILKLLG